MFPLDFHAFRNFTYFIKLILEFAITWIGMLAWFFRLLCIILEAKRAYRFKSHRFLMFQ